MGEVAEHGAGGGGQAAAGSVAAVVGEVDGAEEGGEGRSVGGGGRGGRVGLPRGHAATVAGGTIVNPDGFRRVTTAVARCCELARVLRRSVRSAVVDVLDTYSGHTDPGGAAARRDLGALTITKVSVGPMDNNAYLLVCTATGEALLIDAANEPDRLAGVVGAAKGAQLRTTVTTHRHYDHWQALGAVAEKFGTRQLAHPLDAPELPVPVDDTVEHGDTITVGRVPLEVIHLRGHTPGSIALVYRGGRRPAPVHGRLAVPRRSGQDGSTGRLRVADGRPRGARVRHPAGRDVGLPRPRRRHHPRPERPHLAGVARARLVIEVRRT